MPDAIPPAPATPAAPAKPIAPTPFFVYLVESPSPHDMYFDRDEGNVLSKVLSLNGVSCPSRKVGTRALFEEALISDFRMERERRPQHRPVLHISCHGNSDGLGFTDDSNMPWEDLAVLLRPINKALSGGLVMCMSSCESYMGVLMAMETAEVDQAFFAMVGTSVSPTWKETAVGFTTFYHHLAAGRHVSQCVEAMKASSLQPEFHVAWGAQIQKRFQEGFQRRLAEKLKESEKKA